MREIPSALIKLVLPTAFVPYNNKPSFFPSPKTILPSRINCLFFVSVF